MAVFGDGFGLSATVDAVNDAGGGSTLRKVSLTAMIGRVVGALLSLVGIAFFVLVVYGGLMWMTAQGNQDTVKRAIRTVLFAAIGLIVTLSAYAITTFVLQTVQ